MIVLDVLVVVEFMFMMLVGVVVVWCLWGEIVYVFVYFDVEVIGVIC